MTANFYISLLELAIDEMKKHPEHKEKVLQKLRQILEENEKTNVCEWYYYCEPCEWTYDAPSITVSSTTNCSSISK